MAVQEKGSKLSRHILRIKTKLDALCCPFIEGMEESWIANLVYKPGEHRIRLLQWLFTKFDSRLDDILNPRLATVETKMDSRIQRLLFVASSLGLCGSDDADLIRGSASVSKQTSFMDQLLDLVCIIDEAEDPSSLQIPGTVSSGMNIEEQFSNDCFYLDSLAIQEKVSSLFKFEAKLLPPDLSKQAEVKWLEQGFKDTLKPPVPDIEKLCEQVDQVSKDMNRQAEIMEQIKKKQHHEPVDPETAEKVERTLRLTLPEMSQIMVGFTLCFENEMQQWCNRSSPQLNQLGPAFRRVHVVLEHFTDILESIGKIHQCYSSVASCRQSLDMMSENKAVSEKSKRNSTKDCIEEFIEVLGESVARHNTILKQEMSLLDCSSVSHYQI